MAKKSFFTRIREFAFKTHVEYEIFDRIFPHTLGEEDHGYPFQTAEEMNAQTEERNARLMLDRIEAQIRAMPKGYGESFRYVLHRDLQEFLSGYERIARQHARRPELCQISGRGELRLIAP